MNGLRSYAPNLKYKPQFAYQTPDGYRDELFLIPFTFQVNGNGTLTRGIPLSMDDDTEWWMHAIFFPQVSQWDNVPGQPIGTSPGYVRVWDTKGNPLTQGLVYSLGMWGMGGIFADVLAGVETFGWGFVFEPAVQCDPGGTLLWDFQLDTNAKVATLLVSGGSDFINFAAGIYGTAGNATTLQFINPGAPNVPLSVAVVGGTRRVQITLATNGASALISTFQDVYNLVNSSPVTAGFLVAWSNSLGALQVVPAMAETSLGGGAASTPFTVQGTVMGVKRFKAC